MSFPTELTPRTLGNGISIEITEYTDTDDFVVSVCLPIRPAKYCINDGAFESLVEVEKQVTLWSKQYESMTTAEMTLLNQIIEERKERFGGAGGLTHKELEQQLEKIRQEVRQIILS